MQDAAFGEWLLSRSRRVRRRPLSVHTVRQKQSQLTTVRGVAAELSGTHNQAMSSEELATWLTDRENVCAMWDVLSLRTQSGTQRNTYYALRDFESYAKANRWATSLALEVTDLVPRTEGPVVTFTPDEVHLIEIGSRMKGLRWHMFSMTLVHSGMRIGNALALRYEDLKPNHAVPHFALPTSKTGQPLVVPLNGPLRALWCEQNINVLRSEVPAGNRIPARDILAHPFPWSYSNALNRWTQMLTALDVEYRSPHKLRATLATDLLLKGAPLLGVSRLLGHSSVNTTQKYYAAVDALSYADLLERDFNIRT